jgi:hypothetical protein
MVEVLGWSALVLVAAWCAAHVVAVLLSYGSLVALTLADTAQSLLELVRRPAEVAFAKRRHRKDRRELLDWFDRSVGAAGDEAVNRDVLRAQAIAPQIKKLIREQLPKAITTCVHNHRVAALAAGVDCIWDIAAEPECCALRERVTGFEDALILKLESYPFLLDDEGLLHNLLILRRMRATCGACPYLEHSVYSAPLLCPTAELAGLGASRRGQVAGTQ